ncbi:MAG: AbrB/MazE/SpoVT family DNA-binding domain-containing protein [Brachymonas sp.]|nr:AbrB/MazE/SpoVT family DNA-binding domain-containing protein [Brachymonas sp.]NJS36893.1 AbrB/MazE/SpoVT family DNA-binding domain-containing protein [Brachymonas sp.]
MLASTVSDKGQVVIPAAYRKMLGIKPGTELDFELEGSGLRVSLRHEVQRTAIDEGFGMLTAKAKEGRRLADFDVANAMKAQR